MTAGPFFTPPARAAAGAAVAGAAVAGAAVAAGERGASPAAQSSPAVLALAQRAQADSTRRGYASDWTHFAGWASRHQLDPLPAAPRTVAQYVAYLAEAARPNGCPAYTPATLARRVAGINFVHRRAGHPTPGSAELVKATLAGLRRTRDTPPRRMKALPLAILRTALDTIDVHTWPDGVIGRRDQALLLLGWAAALRRTDLAALDRADLTAHPADGLHLLIRTSKTDPDASATLTVPFGTTPATCAACAVTRWVQILDAWDGYTYPRLPLAGRAAVLRLLLVDQPPDAGCEDTPPGTATLSEEGETTPPARHVCHHPSNQTSHPVEVLAGYRGMGEGPLLRPVTRHGTIGIRPLAGDAVHAVLRRRLAAAGINPDGYGAHSLRAGFVTDAYRAGASTHAITRQTRHRDPATVRAYARYDSPLEVNAVTQVGL